MRSTDLIEATGTLIGKLALAFLILASPLIVGLVVTGIVGTFGTDNLRSEDSISAHVSATEDYSGFVQDVGWWWAWTIVVILGLAVVWILISSVWNALRSLVHSLWNARRIDEPVVKVNDKYVPVAYVLMLMERASITDSVTKELRDVYPGLEQQQIERCLEIARKAVAGNRGFRSEKVEPAGEGKAAAKAQSS